MIYVLMGIGAAVVLPLMSLALIAFGLGGRVPVAEKDDDEPK